MFRTFWLNEKQCDVPLDERIFVPDSISITQPQYSLSLIPDELPDLTLSQPTQTLSIETPPDLTITINPNNEELSINNECS